MGYGARRVHQTGLLMGPRGAAIYAHSRIFLVTGPGTGVPLDLEGWVRRGSAVEKAEFSVAPLAPLEEICILRPEHLDGCDRPTS